MYPVGSISEKAARLLKATKECLKIGIKQCRPGNHFGNIGYAIYNHAASYRYSVVYQFVGHGVGLKFHESPQIHHVARKNSGELMQTGNIFTIEPMICEKKPEAVISETDHWTASTTDGGLSAQYEHTILITDDGHEILTI